MSLPNQSNSKYSISEIGYILYNNRSHKVVMNFIDKSINIDKLIEIEEKFEWCKSSFEDMERMVEVDVSLLDSCADDDIVTPSEISQMTDFMLDNLGIFSDTEIDFLIDRKFPLNLCKKYGMLGLSNFKDSEHLRIIGAKCHPILKSFLQDGIEGGGIVHCLFENNILVNCSIRRISDVGKLKYTLAVPDVPVWGLSDIYSLDEVYICEGIFDMISLRENGFKSCSPSSAAWSGIQLYKLLEKNPRKIIIFADNDRVGFKTAATLVKFFNISKIPCSVIHSTVAKDASEHFFEKGMTYSDVEEININRDMIESKIDNSFNFLKYLQTRKF